MADLILPPMRSAPHQDQIADQNLIVTAIETLNTEGGGAPSVNLMSPEQTLQIDPDGAWVADNATLGWDFGVLTVTSDDAGRVKVETVVPVDGTIGGPITGHIAAYLDAVGRTAVEVSITMFMVDDTMDPFIGYGDSMDVNHDDYFYLTHTPILDSDAAYIRVEVEWEADAAGESLLLGGCGLWYGVGGVQAPSGDEIPGLGISGFIGFGAGLVVGSGLAPVPVLDHRVRPAHGAVLAYDAYEVLWIPTAPTGGGMKVSLVLMSDAPITTGVKKAYVTIPRSGTLSQWRVTSDVSTTSVLKILHSTLATYPTFTEVSDSGARPSLTTDLIEESSTLTGWTMAVAAGDILDVEVISNSAATRLVIDLWITE